MAATPNWFERICVSPFACANQPNGLNITTYQSTNGRLNDPARKLAFGFFPVTTSPITHFCFFANITGTMTGITYIGQIETDSSQAPSGTLSGAASSSVAAPAADGWISETALGTQTGTLSLNTRYWLVILDGGGTAPTTSNYTVIMQQSTNFWGSGGTLRCYNGSDWTTVSVGNGEGAFYVKHADGSYTGMGTGVNGANTAVGDIYSTARQGIRGAWTQAQTIIDARFYPIKAGTPSDLEVSLYEADTLKQTVTVPVADVSGGAPIAVQFTPVTIAANTYVYVILHQASDGGDDSNDYKMRTNTTVSGLTALVNSSWRFVYGTSTTPSSLTVSTTELPNIALGATNLSGAGGAVPAPGFNTGFN